MTSCVLLFVLLLVPIVAFSEDPEEPDGMINMDIGEYSFSAVQKGDASGEPVILLHGFPETSAMWDRFQDLLGQNGYYSLAPDQRGYSRGARPYPVREYRIEALAGDVIALADAKGLESFHLIGHDWGSAVAWYVAAHYPDRIRSLTALSVPHLEAFRVALTTDPDQHDASSYIRLFQWPVIPEIFLRARGYRNLKAIWQHSTDTEIQRYMTVLAQPGALRAAVNWYRANYKALTGTETTIGPVDVPTLFIWGTMDPAILRSGAELNRNHVTGDYSEFFADSGHWLMQETYAKVSGRILEHLGTWRGRVSSL